MMRDSKGRFIKGYKPIWSPESREKVSGSCKKARVGKWMTGRKLSEEIKKKISENSPRYWLGKKRENMTGKNHPLWKEGKAIAEIKRLIRHSFEYNQWRSKVYERDDYTCILCKRKEEVSGKLNADHYPVSFSEILEKNNIQTREDSISCQKLWDINNGRTLCEECHRKTDNYFYKAIKNKGHRRDLLRNQRIKETPL